jgi:hypothetical protein
MTTAKRCSRCGVVKALADFYKHSGMKDGLQHRCKVCHVECNRKSRLSNPETKREQMRRWLEHHGARERARKAAWTKLNREKHQAHQAVYRAVQSGELDKPTVCSFCGTDKFRIEAHHDDYSFPLDVVWLCSACHGQRHIELKGVAA